MVDELVKAPTALVAALHGLGWELRCLDIDRERKTAYVLLRRHDGLRVELVVNHHTTQIIRERDDMTHVPVGRRGDRTVVDRVERRFLGRTRYETPEAGLRGLSEYVVDNGNGKALPAEILPLLLNP